MSQSEFDRFAEDYEEQLTKTLSLSGETPDFFACRKAREAAKICADLGLQPNRILDFGSGLGSAIPHLKREFPGAQCVCTDVSKRCLDVAVSRYAGQAEFVWNGGTTLPLDDGCVDLVFCAGVFHHIGAHLHVHWLQELRRVIRAGGVICIFEHNPHNPLTVKIVESCAFDEDAELVRSSHLLQRLAAAGWQKPDRRYILFFPKQLSWLRPLERFLSWIPLGAQYIAFARIGASDASAQTESAPTI